MLSLFACLLPLSFFLTAAAQNATSYPVTTLTRTSYLSSSTCITKSAKTTAAPTPLPTYSTTSTCSVASTILETTTTVPSVVVVTASPTPYTSTVFSDVFVTTTITQGTQTSVTFVYTTSTVGTLTTTSTICTNGISAPVSTVTKYSGTYTPVSGQPTTTAHRFPIYVNCTTDVEIFYTAYPTVTSGVTTYTYTPDTVVATVTSTTTLTAYTYLPPPGTTTLTTYGTSYVAEATTITTSKHCPATLTTTYSAKCAPTNLIGSVNGDHGIHVLTGVQGSAGVYGGGAAAGQDASKCCQLCITNPGCAAMEAYPAAGNCELYFTNSTSKRQGQCGLAFTYGDDGDTTDDAGQGFIVQSGCGTIEPVADS